MDMAVHPRLRLRRRISPDEAGVAVRQVYDEEMGLLLDAADDSDGFAEICLRMSRWVGQRHEHLPAPPFALPNVVLDDRVAAGETMLYP